MQLILIIKTSGGYLSLDSFSKIAILLICMKSCAKAVMFANLNFASWPRTLTQLGLALSINPCKDNTTKEMGRGTLGLLPGSYNISSAQNLRPGGSGSYCWWFLLHTSLSTCSKANYSIHTWIWDSDNSGDWLIESRTNIFIWNIWGRELLFSTMFRQV